MIISDWFTAHGLAVEAGASAVSAILAAVLVWTTIKYARGTARILEESRMVRLAAEAQAAAAQRSLELLRQQLEEQLGLGRSVIHSTITSATSAIAYWKEQDLKSLAKVHGLPSTDSLVPGNALSAVDYARRISPEAAQELSAAFDDLRHARNEIDSMKQVDATAGQGTSFFDLASDQAEKFLQSASVRIQKVLGLIPLKAAD